MLGDGGSPQPSNSPARVLFSLSLNNEVITVEVPDTSEMASGGLAKELTCCLCNELYKEPVMVECGHSFCRGCVDKAWAGQDSFICLNCKEVITEKRYTPNQALAALVTSSYLTTKSEVHSMTVCPEHEEQLKLYCTDDGSLLCIICLHAPEHAGHRCLPINDAVGKFQSQLSTLVNPLEKNVKEAEEVADRLNEKIRQHKSTKAESRHHIVSEFKLLKDFLMDQKKKLLEELQKQSQSLLEDMEANAAKMDKDRGDLREAISEVHERLDGVDPYALLNDIKQVIKQYQELPKTIQRSVSEKQLCQGTFKGPIQYMAWRHLQTVVSPEYPQQSLPMTTEELQEKCEDYATDPPDQTEMECDSFPVSTEEEPRPGTSSVDRPMEECDRVPVTTEKEQRPGKSTVDGPETKMIWISGDHFIRGLCRYSKKSSYGVNLGFHLQNWTVCWRPILPKWSLLLPKMKTNMLQHGMPDIIVIHMGFTDLEKLNHEDVKKGLNLFAQLFPVTEFILSSALPRREWMADWRWMEDCRKGFNAMISTFSEQDRFQVIHHYMLENELLRRYQYGGSNELNSSENEIFLTDIRNYLEKVMLKICKKTMERVQQQPKTIMYADPVTDNAQRQGTLIELLQPSPGKEMKSGVTEHNIWIFGNPYVSLAHRHAQKSPYGENLGFQERNCTVHWMGTTKFCMGLRKGMEKARSKFGTPLAVVIHLGSYDLSNRNFDNMMQRFKSDLAQVFTLYPKTKFVWSAILPEVQWMKKLPEDRRLMFNSCVGSFAKANGCEVVRHEELEKMIKSEFTTRSSATFLSSSESDLFVKDIRDSLLKVLENVTS